MTARFDLERFVEAQNHAGAYERALSELRAGRKESHWMWFVFPQLEGLGRSPTARRYAIRSLDEARAYLAHPVLGSRLRTCAGALLELEAVSADQLLGAVDAMKLRSCMTLFAQAAPDQPPFGAVLERYFEGRADEQTRRLLSGAAA